MKYASVFIFIVVSFLSFAQKQSQANATHGIPLKTFSYSNYCSAYKIPDTRASFGYKLLLSDRPEDLKLNEVLCHLYAGKDTITLVQAAMKAESIDFFVRYKSSASQMIKFDSTLITLGEWLISYQADVVFNSANLLTLEYTRHSNEGSRHGATDSKYYSFSVRDQRQIKLTDIFNPKDSMVVKEALIRSMRKSDALKGVDEQTALTISLPTDFYVTPPGITLLYPMMAPGGGMVLIPFFISFQELGDKVKRKSWME